MKSRIVWRFGKVLMLILAAVLLSACAQKARPPQGMLDTPLHHYKNGMRLLDSGRLERSLRSFDQALTLNDEYGPALAGKGLVLVAQGEIKEGLELIEDGQDEADDDSGHPEVLWTQVTEIRAALLLYGEQAYSVEELLDNAESAWKRALKSLKPDAVAGAMAWYWYGEAQMHALEFDQAVVSYRAARKLGGDFSSKAAERLQLLEKIREAALVTSVGKRIALVDAVSRADMAALLVEELGVEKFFEQTAAMQEERFVPPSDAESPMADVTDLDGYPLAEDIYTVLHHGLRGLECFADGTFQPDRPLTRAEAALVAEDIYVRAKNDPAMATRYVGTKSPFVDVRGDHPYFNAVMFATSRGFFHADVKGQFGPAESISGVEAVLLIHSLREQLDIF